MTWEQRWHPLREEWVVVAAHRGGRPWSGETRAAPEQAIAAYDPSCYLCPGNPRVSGQRNPEYEGVFVFDNDHPCVGPDAPRQLEQVVAPYANRRAEGLARVVCYSPRHDLTLAELELARIEALLGAWQEQYRELAARPEVAHVLCFENKGEVVGVSNPHPHCQIYATNFVFKTIEIEAAAASRHYAAHGEARGRSLMQAIIEAERADGRRVLCEHGSAIAFVPYFARWSYETIVTPKEMHASIADLSAAEIADFAAALREVLVRFDNLWRMPFPYVAVLHQAPCGGAENKGFHFHMQIHTPLREPGLLKYMAGPEMGGGNFLTDSSPEDKAAELLAVPTTHYRQSASGSK